MSHASLRQAVRELLEDVEASTPIDPTSRLGRIRTLLREDEARDTTRPPGADPAARQMAALVDALHQFRQFGGSHFVGCPASKAGGVCSESCRRAQLALDPAIRETGAGLVRHLSTAIDALDSDRRALQDQIRRLRNQLRNAKDYHKKSLREVLAKAKADTGFEMRRPGRPRKHAPQQE